MSADVSVPGGVLDGAVMRLPGIRLVLKMDSITVILRHQTEVDEIDVVLLRPAVPEQQVLSFDVVVNVAFRVDVFEDVENLEGQVEADFAGEQLLPGLEYLLQVVAESVHDEEAILLVMVVVAATSAVAGHAQRAQAFILQQKLNISK